MLRASIEQNEADYDLNGVIGEGDGGIPEGALLIEFAETVVGKNQARISRVRGQILTKLGPAALVDAAGVIATFNAIDRVADATGTPLEEERIESTAALRADLGIDRFPSATTQ